MRYFKNILWAAAAWLLSGAALHIPSFFISGVIHPALCEWFPALFVEYSPVSRPEQYAVMSATLSIINSTLAIFIISYFCVRLDNERMEYMISRTEGLYTFRDGAALYFPRYWKADLAVALTAPLPLVALNLFIPERLPAPLDSLVGDLLSFTRGYTDILGTVGAVFVMCLTLLVCRLVSGALSIRTWQAAWLSDIG